jgi:exonuclease VII small subunit
MAIADLINQDLLKEAWSEFESSIDAFEKARTKLNTAIQSIEVLENYDSTASAEEKDRVDSYKGVDFDTVY